MKKTVASILFLAILFLFSFFPGVKGAESPQYELETNNLLVKLNDKGKIVGLIDLISKNSMDNTNCGFEVTDGKTNEPILMASSKVQKDEKVLILSGPDKTNDFNMTYTIKSNPTYLSFKLDLENKSKEQKWLYIKFKTPILDKQQGSYWDGNVFRNIQSFALEKRLDTGFPMTCVFYDESGLACGLEATQLFSWIDNGIDTEDDSCFYWGVKMVLDPQQKDQVEFILYGFKNDYQYLNALDIYYSIYPEQFSPKEGVDKRTVSGSIAPDHRFGFPLSRNETGPRREMLRRTYTTYWWWYAPFKRAGNIYDRDEYYFWGNREADSNPNFGKTAAEQRARKAELVSVLNRYRYNVAPMYYFINVVEENLSEVEYKGSRITDPKSQNYMPGWVRTYHATWRTYMWGNDFAEATMKDIKDIVNDMPYIGGFALDCAGGTARHRGDGMNESPGRAYDEEGVFVSENIGNALMLDYIHTLRNTDGKVMAVVANKPSPYQVAFRVDSQIDEKCNLYYATNEKEAQRMRFLLGKKVMTQYHVNNRDSLGQQINWQNRSAEELRAIIRNYYKTLTLLAFKYNMRFTTELAAGSKNIMRSMPILLELHNAGWEVIPAVSGDNSLWYTRYGKDTSTYIFVGNPGNVRKTGTISIDSQYLGDKQYLFTTYEGAQVENLVANGMTEVQYGINDKEYTIFKAVLGVKGSSDLQATVHEEIAADHNYVFAELRNLQNAVEIFARKPEASTVISLKVNGREVPFEEHSDYVKFATDGSDKVYIELKFKSNQFLSPESLILNYPQHDFDKKKPTTKIIIPAVENFANEAIAWWIQEYYRVYAQEVLRFGLILPIESYSETVKKDERMVLIGGDEILEILKELSFADEAAEIALSDSAIKLVGGKILVIYGKTEELRRNIADKLLTLWDKKYEYYGSPGRMESGLGTSFPEATRLMFEKAGLIGKVADEEEEWYSRNP